MTWGYFSSQFGCLLTADSRIISADNADDLHFVLGKLPGEPRQINASDDRPLLPWREWLGPAGVETAEAARARGDAVWL